MIKKLSKTEAKICCGGNCVQLEFQDGIIIITDDYGGQVKLSTQEASELSEAAAQCQP
jgi:hypothetical protein